MLSLTITQNCRPQGNHTAHSNDSNTYVIDSIYRFTSIFTAVGTAENCVAALRVSAGSNSRY